VKLPVGKYRNTKVVCTMGPACWDVDTLGKMMDIGMNVCRLNFSHGDHEAHGATVERIREAAAARPHLHVGILLDTKGPEIRTGFFADKGGKIQLKCGQNLRIVTDYSFLGDASCIACTYEALPQAVVPGNKILMADGSVTVTVTSIGDGFVDTRVENDAAIGERKNMNLPGVKVDLPVLQPKDVDDLVNFGIPQGVDYVAASFVQSAADIALIRETLGEAGADIKIIAKIENQEGLENFDEILEATDGIMVARGDLGMEIPPEEVFIAQKLMIERCNLAGKSVITATQMLESMTGAPRPTRAEASDVANAVLDGTDAVMLSGETAGGAFPLEAVQCMVSTSMEAEKMINYEIARKAVANKGGYAHTIFESTTSAAVKTSLETGAKAIIVVNDNERILELTVKYRPQVPVILATTNAQKARQTSGYNKNVYPVVVADADPSTMGGEAIAQITAQGFAEAGDCVVMIMQLADSICESPIVRCVQL